MTGRLGLVACLCAAVAFVAPAYGEGPKPFPDFTFKRIKVPKPGASNRITVQIDPNAPLAEDAADPVASGPVTTSFDWYWTEISPAMADTGPGRLQKAVLHLRKGSVPTPRLQTLQSIVTAYGSQILMATIGTRVSPALALAVMSTESAGQPDAISTAGAAGLMQLMPDTATRFGVQDRSDPAQNIAGGVKYLDWLMDEFDGDPILVLAGYNAGENAVRKHSGVPPYAETRGYVPKVLAAWTVARGLCLTPPELISDGCAFGNFTVARDGG